MNGTMPKRAAGLAVGMVVVEGLVSSMNVEYDARPARHSFEITASIVLLLVLVAGLFTYKGSTALTRLREVQSTGVLRVNPNVLFAPGASSGAEVLGQSVRYLIIVGPALLFGVLIGGVVWASVSPSWLARAFGGGGIREHLVAGASGAPLMLCSCCVAPVFSAIYERSLRCCRASGLHWPWHLPLRH